MLKIGITGQNGFIGAHLFNTLGLHQKRYQRVIFQRAYFDDDLLLDAFVSDCDVIVHLAGLNRHSTAEFIYETNFKLAQKLVNSLKRTGSNAYVIFSSSSQESKDNVYGKSKKDARNLFSKWAMENGGRFTGLIIPNVFGPFGNPFYNSVIATFSYQLTQNQSTHIDVDASLKLIYVADLVLEINCLIDNPVFCNSFEIDHTIEVKVSEILVILNRFREDYIVNGIIPSLTNRFELNLFNTFRSYIDIGSFYPVSLKKNTDTRGVFTEIVKLQVGGQISFSITLPDVVRGEHFHTRKIERFVVVKGNALIQLRKVGTEEIFDFQLSGNDPAYVDMPIWYTHNIRNIGSDDLYTIFWISEFYNPNDSDTYLEKVIVENNH